MDSAAPQCLTSLNHILVCGLGSLGQHCVELLKEFGVQIWAIDNCKIEEWEIPEVQTLLTNVVVGDCRQAEILRQAQLENCRSVLIVTGDERVNLETAFAARLLNPAIRIIIRSSKRNLNTLLEQQLGNFIALEPTLLSVPAFALAALGQQSRFHLRDTSAAKQEILGFFAVDRAYYQVIKRRIQPHDRGCNVMKLHELNTRSFKVLSHQSADSGPSEFDGFYRWDSQIRLKSGDWLISIEQSEGMDRLDLDPTFDSSDRQNAHWPNLRSLVEKRRIKTFLLRLWGTPEQSQLQRVGLFCGVAVLTLLLFGTVLLYWNFPNISLVDAFYTTSILLLGGYGDLFGDFHVRVSLPEWLRLLSLGLTLAGTAFIGVLYALLTEKLISWRLQFLSRQMPLPKQNHIVVVGLDRVGQGVLSLLHGFKQPLVGLAEKAVETSIVPNYPLLIGSVAETLKQANLETAKSVVAIAEDAMDNLELALMAHRVNPQCRLVLRTYDRRFTEQLSQLFPFANVLSVSALSSEAFVAATFGEKVFNLFRIDRQTILTTEYRIETGDTLNGSILAEIAYGYGVVPILHQRSLQESATLMPSDDVQLRIGDRLVVLTTTNGLRRIELGEMSPRLWQVQVEKALTSEAVFVGANEISRISGCDLKTSRSLMSNLPGILPLKLYDHQAQRLVRRLSRVQVIARAISSKDTFSDTAQV